MYLGRVWVLRNDNSIGLKNHTYFIYTKFYDLLLPAISTVPCTAKQKSPNIQDVLESKQIKQYQLKNKLPLSHWTSDYVFDAYIEWKYYIERCICREINACYLFKSKTLMWNVLFPSIFDVTWKQMVFNLCSL